MWSEQSQADIYVGEPKIGCWICSVFLYLYSCVCVCRALDSIWIGTTICSCRSPCCAALLWCSTCCSKSWQIVIRWRRAGWCCVVRNSEATFGQIKAVWSLYSCSVGRKSGNTVLCDLYLSPATQTLWLETLQVKGKSISDWHVFRWSNRFKMQRSRLLKRPQPTQTLTQPNLIFNVNVLALPSASFHMQQD